MTSGELLALFRDDVLDNIEPYLWTDLELYAYMNDAYFMFVRLTGGISDATSTATRIPIVAGERSAVLHPSVLRIRQATLLSTDRQLAVINAQDVGNLSVDDHGLLRQINRVVTPGPVTHIVSGLQEGYVEWIQVPIEDDEVALIIERLPLEPITNPMHRLTDVSQEHHFHLMKWMRHLAHRKSDPDTFDIAKSDSERQEFLEYCDLAQREKERRRHKVRVVRYGGI